MSYLKANDVTDVKTFLGGWRDGGSVESTGCSFRGFRLCSQYPHNNLQHLQPRFLGVQHPLFVSKDMHVCGTYVQKLTHTPEMKINLKQLLDSVMAERPPPHKYNIMGNFKKWFTVSVLFCFEHLYHENFSSFYMFLETRRQCLYASPHYICNT